MSRPLAILSKYLLHGILIQTPLGVMKLDGISPSFEKPIRGRRVGAAETFSIETDRVKPILYPLACAATKFGAAPLSAACFAVSYVSHWVPANGRSWACPRGNVKVELTHPVTGDVLDYVLTKDGTVFLITENQAARVDYDLTGPEAIRLGQSEAGNDFLRSLHIAVGLKPSEYEAKPC